MIVRLKIVLNLKNVKFIKTENNLTIVPKIETPFP